MIAPSTVAIDLDGTLGDTNGLWRAWLDSVGDLFGFDAAELPADRGEAAAALDLLGAGNWRTLLERFAEDRAPVYLRRDPAVGAALRAMSEAGCRIGVFTDAPEELAQVALDQLGAGRRAELVETGTGALDRLLVKLGAGTVVVRARDELLELAA